MALRRSFISKSSSLRWFSFCSSSLSAATFLRCCSCSTIIKRDWGLNSLMKSGRRKKGITEPIKNGCQNFVCHKLYATRKMFSRSSSFEKMMTKLFVNGSFWGFPLFIPLLSMNKWGLVYRVSFRWVLMIKLVIASDLKYVPRKLATHKIFQKKKRKKRKSSIKWRFQESQVFL